MLPRTIVISILGFNQFPNLEKFHSEFRCLEVTTGEQLTDKQILHFYELKKLSPLDNNDRGKDLWLKLFNAETEEELTKIEEMGVPVMSEAIVAYRHVAASDKFIQMEKSRSKTRHDEAQALGNAEKRGEVTGMEKMIITALQSNAPPEIIIAMQKSAGITDTQLDKLKAMVDISK